MTCVMTWAVLAPWSFPRVAVRSMPYVSALIDRVVLIKWQTPTGADVLPVLAEIKSAHERLAKPVIGIALIPTGTSAPSDEVRPLMGKCMTAMLDYAESLHFVVEGYGFWSSFARGVISSLLLIGGKRGRIFVHRTLTEALASLRGKIGVSPEDFLQQARRVGIVPSSAADAKAPRV